MKERNREMAGGRTKPWCLMKNWVVITRQLLEKGVGGTLEANGTLGGGIERQPIKTCPALLAVTLFFILENDKQRRSIREKEVY